MEKRKRTASSKHRQPVGTGGYSAPARGFIAGGDSAPLRRYVPLGNPFHGLMWLVVNCCRRTPREGQL